MMKRSALRATACAVTALLLSLRPVLAQGQTFNVGDRVTIGSTGETGTVISVGQQMINGGVQLKVHLDRMGTAFPDVGVPYDSVASGIAPLGGGGNQQPQQQPIIQGLPPGQPQPGQPIIQGLPPGQPQPGMAGAPAGNQPFNVGDRVTIGATGEAGTVV